MNKSLFLFLFTFFEGSPYTLRVSGAPDASKVKCYGPGIEDGVLHNFQSHFIVETRGAGAGQLTVRVRGPKGQYPIITFVLLCEAGLDLKNEVYRLYGSSVSYML